MLQFSITNAISIPLPCRDNQAINIQLITLKKKKQQYCLEHKAIDWTIRIELQEITPCRTIMLPYHRTIVLSYHRTRKMGK